MRRSYIASAWLLLLAGCAHELQSEPQSELPTEAPVATASHELLRDTGTIFNVVAHQDDDIGQIGNQMKTALAGGAKIASVFVTDGSGGFECSDQPLTYSESRARGNRRAYEALIGLPVGSPDLTSQIIPYPPTGVFTNPGEPNWELKEYQEFGPSGTPYWIVRARLVHPSYLDRVTLYYVGLHNYDFLNPLDHEVPKAVWTGGTETARPTDERQHLQAYDKEKLTDLIHGLMAKHAPTIISLSDPSSIWPPTPPFDNSDHYYGALFGLAASQRYTGNHRLQMIRGYNAAFFEADNVSPTDTLIWGSTVGVYRAYDPKICANGQTQTTICGNTIGCDDMNGVPYKDFPNRYYADLMIRTEGTSPVASLLMRKSSSTTECLSSAAASGSQLNYWECDPNNPDQLWSLAADGSLRHAGLCATGNGVGQAATLQTCQPTTSATWRNQRFALSTVGQLRGPGATCLTWQFFGAPTLQACDGVDDAQLGWSLNFRTGGVSVLSSNLSDTYIPNNDYYYNSLSMADLNADGRADLCVRRPAIGTAPAGLYCALQTGSAAVKTTASFTWQTTGLSSFGSGWDTAGTGGTVQLGDLTNDGRAEVCGRLSTGIWCADRTTADAWTNYSLRTSSFGASFAAAPQYSSIRLVDVNRDGRADVCGIDTTGAITCALKSTTDASFSAATSWVDSAESKFSTANGFTSELYTSTLNFADVDGDGFVDACARGPGGVFCMIHNGLSGAAARFERYHRWSFTNQFGDGDGWNSGRYYYATVKAMDVTGDGKADLCGRAPDGLYCGISHGNAFTRAYQFIKVNPFSDADGWAVDKYSRFVAADLNNDKRVDLCARGPDNTLRCSFAPLTAP